MEILQDLCLFCKPFSQVVEQADHPDHSPQIDTEHC